MDCELCPAKDVEVLVILPIHQPCGKLDTMACESCAETSPAYCRLHQKAKQGFIDGTCCCLECVELIVKEYEDRAEIIYFDLLIKLPEDESVDLSERAEMSSEMSGSPPCVSVLRFIASKAARTQKSIDDIIAEMKHQKSASLIFQ